MQRGRLRQYWALGKGTGIETHWKMGQKGMRELDDAVEQSERCWRCSRR